ncbi:hypothetical protein EWM64_g6932 [Hericium alpestre]|uniref:Sulphur transport domain-containing protein n=1 Tax=Hericium alpestre TaxID=135208 RepID=A0A4Y9ZS70_9AGAM|nr:hypothetical protein EWM64_g6932 [Hericium alpestre]
MKPLAHRARAPLPPAYSFLGGIGLTLPVHALNTLNGRVFGISGFLHRAVRGGQEERAAVLGFVLGGLFVGLTDGLAPKIVDANPLKVLLSGLLVGLGTKLSNGCTSGRVLIIAQESKSASSETEPPADTSTASDSRPSSPPSAERRKIPAAKPPAVINTSPLRRTLVSFLTSVSFAFALRLANMTDPDRVLAFLVLPPSPAFDPTLGFLALAPSRCSPSSTRNTARHTARRAPPRSTCGSLSARRSSASGGESRASVAKLSSTHVMETAPQSSSSPPAPARHFDALVKSFFIGPTQEVDEPEVDTEREMMTRSPSRMGFLDDSDEDDDQVPASPSWAKDKESGEGPGGQIKAGGPQDGRLAGSESDSSDEWSNDDGYSAGVIDADDKVLQFVCIFLSCLPTATTQVYLTQVYSGTGTAEHLSVFLIPQYAIMFVTMTALTAYTLQLLF